MAKFDVKAAQQVKLRELFAALHEEQYGGKQVRTAKALGCSPSHVSGVLGGTKNIGAKLVEAMRRVRPKAVADIFGADLSEISPNSEPWQRELAGLPEVLRRAVCSVVYVEWAEVADVLAELDAARAELPTMPTTDPAVTGAWVDVLRARMKSRSSSRIRSKKV